MRNTILALAILVGGIWFSKSFAPSHSNVNGASQNAAELKLDPDNAVDDFAGDCHVADDSADQSILPDLVLRIRDARTLGHVPGVRAYCDLQIGIGETYDVDTASQPEMFQTVMESTNDGRLEFKPSYEGKPCLLTASGYESVVTTIGNRTINLNWGGSCVVSVIGTSALPSLRIIGTSVPGSPPRAIVETVTTTPTVVTLTGLPLGPYQVEVRGRVENASCTSSFADLTYASFHLDIRRDVKSEIVVDATTLVAPALLCVDGEVKVGRGWGGGDYWLSFRGNSGAALSARHAVSVRLGRLSPPATVRCEALLVPNSDYQVELLPSHWTTDVHIAQNANAMAFVVSTPGRIHLTLGTHDSPIDAPADVSVIWRHHGCTLGTASAVALAYDHNNAGWVADLPTGDGVVEVYAARYVSRKSHVRIESGKLTEVNLNLSVAGSLLIEIPNNVTFADRQLIGQGLWLRPAEGHQVAERCAIVDGQMYWENVAPAIYELVLDDICPFQLEERVFVSVLPGTTSVSKAPVVLRRQ